MSQSQLNNPKVKAFVSKLQRSGIDTVPQQLIKEFIKKNNIQEYKAP
tara:strand:- start:941 stop:1081 length:141 start_codon:yes stop_codon:yes gene_type:complete